jgi:iron complex outermembrane recepter protein
MRRPLFLLGASLLALTLAAPAFAQTAPQPDDEQVDQGDVSAVVVTGAPYAVSLDTVTTSVSVVGRDQLDVAAPSGLGDLLAGQPGLRSTFFGPGASRPVIRGLSGPRVLVLQNGVGLVDASALSPDHAVASDPGEASRIEVLRGPSTLAYGGSGIGGVVNIIDDHIPDHIPDGGIDGRISVSAASVDDSRSLSFGLHAASGPVVFSIDGVSRRSEDYDVPTVPVSKRLADAEGLTVDPDRTVRNTDLKLDAYGVGVSFVTDEGFVGLAVKQTETTYGVPYPQITAPIGPDDEGPVAIDLHQTRFDFRSETPVPFGPFQTMRSSIGYADYEHAEVLRDTGETGTRFLSTGVEGRVELVQREIGPLKGAVGVQGLVRHFDSVGDEASVPKTDIEELGVFTLQRFDFETWGVDTGLRIDRRDLDASLAGRTASAPAASYGLNWIGADNAPSFTNVSASVGVFIKPDDTQFYALTVARNARAPTEGELYSDGPHPGTGAFEIGDPTLESEAVISVEATGRWTFNRFRAEGHLWYAAYDGYIDQVPTGDVEDGLPVFRFVQSSADFHGFELEGTYDLWTDGGRTVSASLGADYVRGETDNGPPARIPPWSTTGKLIWESDMFDANVEVRHVAGQDRVAAFELPTDSYTMVNLYGAVKPFRNPDLRLFAELRNATDETAREHVSFLKDIAPLPGRSFRTGVAFRF